MDYLLTTGDRLHDLELDRILARLNRVEAATVALPSPPAPVSAAPQAAGAGVRSISPAGGVPMQDDIVLAVAGSAALSQTAHTLTLTVTTTALPTSVLDVSPGGSAIHWAVPAALTEFNGDALHRARQDLTLATQARIALFLPLPNPAPLAIPTLAAQFSADGGATWLFLDGATGPAVTYGAGAVISGWVALTAGARADVLLRVVGSGGDGATSLPFGTITVQAK